MQAELPELPSAPDPTAEAVSKQPRRIGGVLIFVAIGLIISLIQNLGILQANLAPFRQVEAWERVTTPGSFAYHPNWKSVLLFELISSSAILGLNVVVVALFFRKQKQFPKVTVVVIPVIFVLMLFGYYFSGLIPAVAESPDYSKQQSALLIRFVALHVWIPYFLVSERVRETFVR
ncbi:MAG TPA: DUF2569 domain-containing protein [Pyrinomonadaceae bacterium]|nr:DUF2569 domain-containing protein [Pyrinomonadaceae bacterium]